MSPDMAAPAPRSPPKYPDFCGRRRLQNELQNLNRELGFLQEELQSVEGLQPVSRCCKEVNEFVVANPDPLIPQIKKKHGSCTTLKWIGSKLCCPFSWICFCAGCCEQCECCECLKNLCCCNYKCDCLSCCHPEVCCQLPTCSCKKICCCAPLKCCCCSWNCCKCGPCCCVPSCSCPEYSCGCVFDCPKCTGVKLCPKCTKPCCVSGCFC